MKKNLKNGFSLAEVLISVGIISVVATLGFTLTKKNIDRAYDKYVFTGASALSAAIEDAYRTNEGESISAQYFANYFASLLNIKNAEQSEDGKFFLIAPNNIRYLFETLGTTTDGTPIIEITMTTPGKLGSESSNNLRKYRFYHVRNQELNYPTLFPVPDSIDTRKDLLKYYIDNGSNNGSVEYLSFKEAACRMIGTQEIEYISSKLTALNSFGFMNTYALLDSGNSGNASMLNGGGTIIQNAGTSYPNTPWSGAQGSTTIDKTTIDISGANSGDTEADNTEQGLLDGIDKVDFGKVELFPRGDGEDEDEDEDEGYKRLKLLDCTGIEIQSNTSGILRMVRP